MTIEIRDYDPDWARRAESAMNEVRSVLAVPLVEHIGSTAVPGLAAKPVIDLMAATDDLDAVAAREDDLRGVGYERVDTGMSGRLFYRREGVPVAFHLHVVTRDSWDTRNERLMRDHLLSHPAARDDYARLKRDLAATHTDGPPYTRGKTALIQQLVDAARARRGLPSVDVWED